MIKRVLVVGGAGYIGGSVTDSLLAKKIPFTVYDNLTYENHYLKPVDFIFGDIRDTKKLKRILLSYSHVIWLAAIVGEYDPSKLNNTKRFYLKGLRGINIEPYYNNYRKFIICRKRDVNLNIGIGNLMNTLSIMMI